MSVGEHNILTTGDIKHNDRNEKRDRKQKTKTEAETERSERVRRNKNPKTINTNTHKHTKQKRGGTQNTAYIGVPISICASTKSLVFMVPRTTRALKFSKGPNGDFSAETAACFL